MPTRTRHPLTAAALASTVLATVGATWLLAAPGSEGASFLLREAKVSPHANHAAGADSALAAETERRLTVALQDIETTLTQSPPAIDAAPARRTALAALDAIMRDVDAPRRAAVQRFFHRRIERAVDAMGDTRPAKGARVWLVYNHGFVVRTATVTLCFDLVRARYLPGFAIDRQLMQRIVNACDVLFVSHAHADHAENFVAGAFVAQDKPVIAPEQIGFAGPIYAKVMHLARDPEQSHTVPVRGGATSLSVTIYPGHQDDLDNNVVVVTTADGVTVAHTGDQWNRDDLGWIDDVGRAHHIDILLPNDWTWDIARLVRGFDPALVIPGHANELGHEVRKRDPWLLSYARKRGSSAFGGQPRHGYSQPMVVLTWGESFAWEPAQRDAARRGATDSAYSAP